MNTDDLAGLLAFTVYVAAARVDANADQASRLRSTILPLLDRYRAGEIGEDVIFRQVDEAMGPDWNPSGSWAEQLDKLGFERPAGGNG